MRAALLATPRFAQKPRERILLAREPGYETTTTDFAARFEPAINAQQIAPRRQPIRFPREQTPEYDPIALQQRARHVFDRSCSPLVINRQCASD